MFKVAKGKSLRIFVNSVRRAHWASRLGVASLKHPPIFGLRTVFPQGGLIPCVQVIMWLSHAFSLGHVTDTGSDCSSLSSNIYGEDV